MRQGIKRLVTKKGNEKDAQEDKEYKKITVMFDDADDKFKD